MKAKYSGYEGKKQGGYVTLPPAGAYVGEILNVRVEPSYDKTRDQLVLMLDITEGECAGRYKQVYDDQKERFPDCKFKGTLRILVPEEDDPDDKAWIRRVFEGNLWAVEQSNGLLPNGDPIYKWDWDETKLKGKKVGFSVRKRLYTWNNQDRETTEIAQLESIPEIREGKVRPIKDRDNRTGDADDTGMTATDVTGTVDVPF